MKTPRNVFCSLLFAVFLPQPDPYAAGHFSCTRERIKTNRGSVPDDVEKGNGVTSTIEELQL